LNGAVGFTGAFPPHSSSSYSGGAVVPSTFQAIPTVPTESDFIREWREKRAAVIAEREARAAEEHAKTLDLARKAIDRFYEDYNQRKAKAIVENRAAQEEASYGSTGGNVWERVCREADLIGTSGAPTATTSTKATVAKGVRDTTRMRNVLLDLRKDARAPGNVQTA
jgi:hypothetical protein